MAFTPIENQPIIFNEEIPCYTDNREGYTYPVETSDTTEFAFELTPCDNTASLTGITVTGSDENWTADVDSYTSDGGNGAIDFLLPVALNSKAIWKVTVTIETYTSGELQLIVPGWGTQLMTTNGSHVFYVDSNSPLFTYQLNSVGFIGLLYIDTNNPNWIEVNTANRVDVVDLGGNVIETLVPELIENVAIYSVDWSGYDLGCYTLNYIDGCESFAGSFTGLCNETLLQNTDCWNDAGAGEWSTSPDYGTFWDQLGEPGLARLESTTELQSGYTYQIEYEIVNMNASQFRLAFLGADESTTFIDAIRTSIGVYTLSYTPTQDGVIVLTASQSTGEGMIFVLVKNIFVSITLGFAYTGQSPCICVGDEGTCGITISGCFSNTMTINGVLIPNDFFMKTRIPNRGLSPQGRLFKKQYKAESIIYRNSQGRTDINYFDLTTTMVLRVEQLPAFMFDFIMLWLSFDEMYINDVSYRFADDQLPVILWDDKTELGSADIIVTPVRERTRKVLCGARDQPCIESPSVNALEGMEFMNGDGMSFQDGSGMMFQ